MNGIIATWRDALHQVLDIYERKRGAIQVFFLFLFLFFILLNVACYWWASTRLSLHADPRSLRTTSNCKSWDFGALFDSLSFFVRFGSFAGPRIPKTSESFFHLSLDLVIAILATLWVLFVFTFGGWIISLWENGEELAQRGTKYTNRAVQALQDPTGRENAKNIYFGLIMGVSAALPTCLHLGLFLLSVFRKSKRALFPPKDPPPTSQDPEEPN